MLLSDYAFGSIRVDGREYLGDLIVYPDRVDPDWWRRQGHRLEPEDLPQLLQQPPRLLVIGTGFSGCMEVPAETVAAFEAKGTEVAVSKTAEAVAVFNRLQRQGKEPVAALHLTC